MVPVLEFIIYSVIMFIVGAVTDLIWTPYIRALADKKYFQAGLWSMGTGVCALLLFQGFLVYKATCVFWLLGLFIGTWQAGKILDRRESKRT